MRPFPLVVLLAASCGPVSGPVRRTFPVEVVVRAPAGPLESGWTVEALEGSMAFSELRFFEGHTHGVSRWSPLSLLVSTAWAHPGHYEPGAVVAEVLTPLELDLARREVVPWATADALTGGYGSARLGFGASGVRVTGTARRGSTVVRFDTGVVEAPPLLEGLRFEATLTAADVGRVRLEVELARLLEQVVFDEAGALPDVDGVVRFTPGSVARNGFVRGLTNAGSYRFTWLKN